MVFGVSLVGDFSFLVLGSTGLDFFGLPTSVTELSAPGEDGDGPYMK